MITVIICSVNPEYLAAVKEDIATTIGVPYELLAVDNRNSSKGICQVYNEAAAAAQYPYLCFVHEDVRFHTQNWGSIIAKLLYNPSIGLVGVSGTVYKSKYPGSWVACRRAHYRVHTIQHFNHLPQPILSSTATPETQWTEVAVIDGVFMACKKYVWHDHPFDDSLLKRFHGYDIDFSLAIGRDYKVVVSYEILLEHFSEGSFDAQWIEDSFAVHHKWKSILPLSIIKMGKSDHFSDYLSCSFLLVRLLENGTNKLLIMRYYLLCIIKFFIYNKLKFSKNVVRRLLE